jgi:hypothetical protein
VQANIADTLVADCDVFDLMHTLADESVGVLLCAAGLVPPARITP